MSIKDYIAATLDADGRGGSDLIARGFMEGEEQPAGFTYSSRGHYGEDDKARTVKSYRKGGTHDVRR